MAFWCVLLLQAAGVACGDSPDAASPNVIGDTSDRANEAPVIQRIAFEPASPTPGSPVRVVVDARDPDGDPVKMTYEWSLRGESVGNGTAKLMLADASRDDELEVVVVASDGRTDSDPESLSVRLVGRPPRIDRLRIAPANAVSAGEVIEVVPEARDPEGDAIEFAYTWLVNGAPVDDVSGPEFDTRALARGDVVHVEVGASDGDGSSEPFRSTGIRVTNRPPRVVSRPGARSTSSGFRYRVVAEDPDGDAPLRFELEQAPEGMEIGANSGEIRWLPRPDQGGRHRVRVVVDDRMGGRASHAFDVDVGGDGAPPAAVTP